MLVMRWLLVFIVACSSSDPGGDPAADSCKRGLAYGHDSAGDLQALSSGVSWWYNWATKPDEGATTHSQEYVPMVWGQGSLADAGAQITADAKYLLSFNEPDFTSQANLTPQQAADLWPQVQSIASAHGLKIVSPALNYCGGGCNETNPFDWFDKFFAACADCQVDYLAVHWYACTKDALTSYIGMMKKYDRPIWLTEFACLDSDDTSVGKQQAYMTDVLAYLEQEPAVMRYAWFTGRSDNTPSIDLLAGDGELTDLGSQYVSAPATCSK